MAEDRLSRRLHRIDLKYLLHRDIAVELEELRQQQAQGESVRRKLKLIVQRWLHKRIESLDPEEADLLVTELYEEGVALGPLGQLMGDEHISDILVNGPREVYIEREGRLQLTPIVFDSPLQLQRVITEIVRRVGRSLDADHPMVDARLPDGSRVHVVVPPLSLIGPVMSIRRFGRRWYTLDDLFKFGTLNPSIAKFLSAAVQGRLNILVSGGTASGKTTLLNVLSSSIGETERVVTIEDIAELQLRQPHVIPLEVRPESADVPTPITQRELVRNALRMRPDRIVVGEVRGPEALDMLQAMNTGHDGSLTTVHANSPRDALRRLETLVLMAGFDLSIRAIREQIASAFSVVVQLARFPDGVRRVVSVQEIVGMEQDVISLQEIFTFSTLYRDQRMDKAIHRGTGLASVTRERLKQEGISLEDIDFGTSRGEAD